jgi:hypothetical protein
LPNAVELELEPHETQPLGPHTPHGGMQVGVELQQLNPHFQPVGQSALVLHAVASEQKKLLTHTQHPEPFPFLAPGAQPHTNPFLVPQTNEQKPQSGHAVWPFAWQPEAGKSTLCVPADALDARNGTDHAAAAPIPTRFRTLLRV